MSIDNPPPATPDMPTPEVPSREVPADPTTPEPLPPTPDEPSPFVSSVADPGSQAGTGNDSGADDELTPSQIDPDIELDPS